jgi:uncharacterized repeat protein (TIGR03803 family)
MNYAFQSTYLSPASVRAKVARIGFCCAALLLVQSASSSRAAQLQTVRYRIPAAATNSAVLRRSPQWKWLDLTIGLPLRNRPELTNLLHQIYDPTSPNFHHYLAPEQFAEQFGPTKHDYETVVAFAKSHGLQITGTHPNRTIVSVRATVADVERLFHVTMQEYQHPIESRTFRAPDKEPSLDLTVPILAISGLDDYVIPHPCLHTLAANPANRPQPAVTGSGPGNLFMGFDFRHAYAPGTTLTGTGQSLALLEFDGYYHQDVAAYQSLAGLPNVPITTVLLDGFDGSPGIGNIEVALDIDMAISMAPGLSQVIVYEGTTGNDILNRIATDRLANQASASWTYPVDSTTLQIFQQFGAQGQSFFNSSGDNGAYTGAVATPTDDPYITIVGGTDLTTVSGGGAWISESTWPSSSGGISPTFTIPSWQQGIDMTSNKGSTSYRNLPDVAMISDNCFLIGDNGQGLEVSGTSIATPLWAGLIALANQSALIQGVSTVGFINPAIYGMGKGLDSMPYSSLFHDITVGNNGSPTKFPAVAGYDLCTGWGTPTGTNLIDALAFPEALRISPVGSTIISGPVGGPFNPSTLTFVLTNHQAGSLSWSLANIPSWLNVSVTNGTLAHLGPSTTVTAALAPSVTNLPPGGYSTTLLFSNLTDGFVQSRQITLDIVTPPAIITQPANQAVLIGTAANFSVTIATNALMYYQWQYNGANLTDGGNISGSTSNYLTIIDATSANAGTYSVILSNVAGVLVSSNALLAIVHSAPVVSQQPTNQSVLPGGFTSFSVSAVGDTPYSYRWLFNGTNLVNGINFSGVTTSNLTISNAAASMAGGYSVLVSNTLGSTTSTAAVLTVIPVTPPGITLSTVVSFPGGISGKSLYSPLSRASDGRFYGTTILGGSSADGTVFRFTTNGALSPLFSFNGANGSIPYAGLALGRDGLFYGSTFNGGTFGDGVAFKITIGGGFTTLTRFNGNDGMNPVAGLVLGADGNFYGTGYQGGDYGYGTIFRMGSGGNLVTLASFDLTDGAFPSGVLVQANDGNFYGTTENGGTNGNAGTIFEITPSGNFTSLYSFGGADGAVPVPGLIQAADGNFYGTTFQGGADNFGTVFKLTPAGVLTTLYTFTGGNDGANPWGGLVQAADGNLYGTTQAGGTYGFGTVFQMATTGPLTTVAQFDGFNGGAPSAALVPGLDGGLYGTTQAGGSSQNGAIFRVSTSGALHITGQPADQSSFLGGNALFTVATSGSAPVFYQWQQNGINLSNGGSFSGVNTPFLKITNVAFSNAALYSVVISNAFNSVTSDDAVLEVIYSPAHITAQPASLTAVAGSIATFSVTATGDAPLTFQWLENGTNLTDGGNISGSATSTLTIANVAATNAGSYTVIVSNPIYSTTSDVAQLTVVPPTAPSAGFTSLSFFTDGNDGAFPFTTLTQGKDGNLYGTAEGGGFNFQGSIFKVTLAGAQSTIYSFPITNGGGKPFGRLLQGADGYLYGTTSQGGSNANGTVFRMPTNGGVTYLYSFIGGSDGAAPTAGLVQGADGNFYGTASAGGIYTYGALFKMSTNGLVTPLYSFGGNADGAYPSDALLQGKDGNFYGTTLEGGPGGFGTVFSLAPNGTLTTLASFNGINGAFPQAGVIQGNDGSFYGTTVEGGVGGFGTVYRLTTNGALTTLVSFNLTNGAGSTAELTQGSDGNFYGTTQAGGVGGQGTVFKMTTNGALSTLLWFDGFNGANPSSPLVQASDGNYYGTTALGGIGYNATAGGGNGTVFRLTVPAFTTNPFAAASAIATLPYSSTLTNHAVTPAGDALTFAKVSGPAWLSVAGNGLLSGTPTNSDVGTNVFVVSLTDSYGVTATASMSVTVAPDPPPSFLVSPFAEPWANVDEPYSANISSNATAPYLALGDRLTFGKVSGPTWLNVAADGTLSGTPQGTDGGSNTFVVSVMDLGGSTVNATMSLYVNSPPMFTGLVKPAATVGLLYTGTIATNAMDPDLAAGDSLSFYKANGPSWLNVASNGVLSGVPASTNVGLNMFLLLVVDSGGLAGVGTMQLTVNADRPPFFTSNPVLAPQAQAGLSYSASITSAAGDPDFGDILTFAKLSGPGWLTVAGNGALSGTPQPANAGSNSFVLSVTDFDGLSTNATMLISVAGPIVEAISVQGGSLMLSWTGGIPPYQLQTKTSLAASWQNVGSPTSGTNFVLSPSNAAAFYRIQGQ